MDGPGLPRGGLRLARLLKLPERQEERRQSVFAAGVLQRELGRTTAREADVRAEAMRRGQYSNK